MYCQKCGRENEKSSKFCKYCGAEILEGGVSQPKESVDSDIKEPKVNSILALVFSFLLAPIGLILSIVGLVRSNSYKKKTGKRSTYLALNIVGLIVSILATLFIIIMVLAVGGLYLLFSDQDEQFKGTWHCSYGSFSYNYAAEITFDNNNEFKWAKYGDSENNNYTGIYRIVSRERTNGTNEYTVILNAQEKTINGVSSYNTQRVELDVEFDGNRANIESDNSMPYYCVKAH